MRDHWRSHPSREKKKRGISRDGELPLENGFTPGMEIDMKRKIKSVLAEMRLY